MHDRDIGARSRPPGSRGNAVVIALFVLVASLGIILVLFQRAQALRHLSTRSRFSQDAEAMALSALEEARLRLLRDANEPGTEAYDFLRRASPGSGSLALDPVATREHASRMGRWPERSVEPVEARLVGVRTRTRHAGEEVLIDRPYGFGYTASLRLTARVRVDVAARRMARHFDVRLTNVRPPVPVDRVKLYLESLGGMEPRQLGEILARIAIDEGPEAPLAEKVTSFYLGEEPTMQASFAPLLPPEADYALPMAAASYLIPTEESALRFLYPVESDPTALVLPEGIVVCASGMTFPEWSRFRFHGTIACAGDVRLQGLIREIPLGTDESLVIRTLGKERRIRADERPVEAALVSLGQDSMVEPSSGTSYLQVHGVVASAKPSGILTGVLVYDPVLYNGRAEGPYRAPSEPGSPAPAPVASLSGDIEPAAYRFSMALYASATITEVP